MMREHLIFISEYGKISFGSGKFIITAIDGINRPDIQRQEVATIDSDGKKIVRTSYASKTITVNGYIRADNKSELYAVKLELTRILECKTDGKLVYEVDNRKYFTEAIPSETPVFGDIVQHFIPFTIMFDAYNIYWKALKETKEDVYERFAGIPNLENGKFKFPCIFSYRNNKKTFYNKGNLSCDFTCIIQGISEAGELTAGAMSGTQAYGFQIKNNTTGEHMIINYNVAVGETVTVDTADFSIESSKAGNILHKLKNGTDFFKLAPGKSEIEVTNFNTANNIIVSLCFNETYREV
jgi:predicted phage tail component-like protein